MKKLFTILLFIMTGLVAFAQSEGALPGVFSVSATKKVYFSKGNLQYQASTKTWRFASNQYDYIGDANSNISSTYTGWIDLFGWGTSGWNSGAKAYQPYSTSTTDKDYYPGNSATTNLTGTYANADWGVYNAITNGGNAKGLWRTLTNAEWMYLLSTRSTSLRSLATVNGKSGLIILPDNWVKPSGINYTATTSNCTTNTYSTAQWATMEAAGAVFLPITGRRSGTSMQSDVSKNAYYWSSTYEGSLRAYRMSFRTIAPCDLLPSAANSRHSAHAVRLVQDAPKITITATVSGVGSVSGGGQYYIGEEATLTATPATGSHFLKWSDGNTENPRVITVSEDAVYTAIFVSDTLESIMDVYQDCDLNVAPTNGILDGHEWVDLGLPSGTLWATCNVGASSPEEYGDYFAWGETSPKSNYPWSTYQYGSDYNQLTKYCNKSSYGKNGFTDNKTVLDAEDDAATVNWGSGWRMPTFEEIQELYNNCTNTWTTQNGVYGRKFTASNGNAIFLPAAGYAGYDRDILYKSAGRIGYYWSSSLYKVDPSGAYNLYFYSDAEAWNIDRCYGRSVRPVVK